MKKLGVWGGSIVDEFETIFIIQRHNEFRDLESDLVDLVCNDVETEPALQEITGVTLNSGANLACNAASTFMHVDFGRDKSRPFLI